jgi:hypothetical protein
VLGRRAHGTLARFGLKVGPEIRQRSAHVGAFGAGTWVGEFAPGSAAHREIRVLRDRVEELLDETSRDAAIEAEQMLSAARPAPGMPRYPGFAMSAAGAASDVAGT